MNRLKEIEARLAQIKVELENEGADIDALEQEVKTLTEERKQLLEKIEKRNKIIKDIADGAGTPVPNYLPTEERKDEPKGPDSPVYRTAFLKRLLGQPLTEAEKRAFTLVPPTATAAAAVPTQTYNKIFDQMTKIAPMLSNITLLRVPGNLRLAVQGVRNPAQAHQELAAVNPAADTLVSVSLTGYEFIKVLRISATIRAMAIDAFEDWLARTLGEDLAVAIDNEIINGPTVSGNIANAQVWNAGVNYVQYQNQNNISYEDICNCIAMLPSAFDANAKWLMNKATFYQQIMQIEDGNGNLIAIQSLADGGAWRIMGYPVLIDDNVAQGVVFFGDFTKVVGNLSQDIRVESSAESGFLNNAIDFRGTAIFDCNIAQPTAITKIGVSPQSQD